MGNNLKQKSPAGLKQGTFNSTAIKLKASKLKYHRAFCSDGNAGHRY